MSEPKCHEGEHAPTMEKFLFFDQDLRDGTQTIRSEWRIVCKQ